MKKWNSIFKERSVPYETLDPKEANVLSTAQKYLIHYAKLNGMPSNKAVLAVDDVLGLFDMLANSSNYNHSISGIIDNFINSVLKKKLV